MDRSAIAVSSGMDMPIMHDSDRYELVRGIGSGNFGVARLMRDKLTQELVAVQYIERGDKIADVWYCGVTLYVMLVGAYPFEDPEEPGNFKKTMQRITIPEIQIHEWLLKNLPADLMDDGTMNNQFEEPDQPMQSIQEIMQIISEATIPAAGTQRLNQYLTGSLDIDYEMDEDMDSELDMDSNGEIVYAMCLWRRLLKQDLVRLRVW